MKFALLKSLLKEKMNRNYIRTLQMENIKR
jgi:hypothetical protein